MRTTHTTHYTDARDMDSIANDSINLTVTSPPYPMIEMWDDLFTELNPNVGQELEQENGMDAFREMHDALTPIWDELQRVTAPGGIVCINIGNATRSLNNEFACYPNNARITTEFQKRGFTPLPDILWHKPTNKLTKFMGSGMLPSNAYTSLEHEYILVFRNGGRRRFEPKSETRYQSAYFWEERNQWFTDIWTDITGVSQSLSTDESDDSLEDLRDRSAAYPVELPYRLINMFSVQGDTVLDPFWGTGTTSIAAMLSARHSIGYELNESFHEVFKESVSGVPEASQAIHDSRVSDHFEFTDADGQSFKYMNDAYDLPVKTKQETKLQFQITTDTIHDETDDGSEIVTATHEPHTWEPPEDAS